MHDIMLALHFIGLAMGLGTSFAHMFLGIAAGKMEAEERLKFQMNSMALSRMGHIGLTLLVVTGIYLMGPYWSILPSSPLLMAKLALVLLLGALIGIISSIAKKAKKGDAEAQFKRIEPLGKIAMLTALAIVLLAVFFFH